MRYSPLVVSLAASLASLQASAQPGADETPTTEELFRLLQAQQQEISELRARLEAADGNGAAAASSQGQDVDIERLTDIVEAQQLQIESLQQEGGGAGWSDVFRLGGYGSTRVETSDLDAGNDTFTFRRLVLTGEATPNEHLQAYFELEFERFTELEIEKKAIQEGDELEIEQAVEGTNESEISMEQAWVRYRFDDRLNFDLGALLVPVGRFNINHDDNRWNANIRPLADRGAPATPVKSAWTELGLGFSGQIPAGNGLFDYRVYVMNGAQLDFEMETEIEAEVEEDETKLESIIEAKFGPGRGTFSEDTNNSKALTGRFAWLPAAGQEIAVSGYWENKYTPDFLPSASLWSVALDGFHTLGGLEIEYELVHTEFEDVRETATAFAGLLANKEGEIKQFEGIAETEHKVEVTLATGSTALADEKSGYWVELRYPFRADLRTLPDAQLIPWLRMEQVFFDNLLQGIEFEGGQVTELDTEDSTVSRFTAGFSFRPSPAWVYSLTGEYTWTDEDSLSGLTNFLEAGENEDDEFALRFGVAYGF